VDGVPRVDGITGEGLVDRIGEDGGGGRGQGVGWLNSHFPLI
jgi:hypothetical protein